MIATSASIATFMDLFCPALRAKKANSVSMQGHADCLGQSRCIDRAQAQPSVFFLTCTLIKTIIAQLFLQIQNARQNDAMKPDSSMDPDFEFGSHGFSTQPVARAQGLQAIASSGDLWDGHRSRTRVRQTKHLNINVYVQDPTLPHSEMNSFLTVCVYSGVPHDLTRIASHSMSEWAIDASASSTCS